MCTSAKNVFYISSFSEGTERSTETKGMKARSNPPSFMNLTEMSLHTRTRTGQLRILSKMLTTFNLPISSRGIESKIKEKDIHWK